jgi:hypothetical protein
MTATNKWLLISESQGNSNWCTPVGETCTHNTYASYADLCMPHVCLLQTVSVRGILSRWPNRVGWTLLLPRKKGSRHNPQHAGWPIHRSATQFLFPNSHWNSNESKHLLTNMLHRLIRLISLACDQYVQYLFAGTNLLAFNRHSQGLQPWRSQLYTSFSLPFPTDNSPLSPNGPTRSQVNHPTKFKVQD